MCIVNRLRPILDEIISPKQSAFVPSRRITDNAIIAFECTHEIQKLMGEEAIFVRISWICPRRMTASIGIF
jgi:hypothetical protein